MGKNLRVWYGVDRLNKIMKKPAVSVVYENERYNSDKNERKVKQRMDVAYMRYQTDGEADDAENCSRVFHVYTMYIFEKPYKGDIEFLLNQNYLADENHVSAEEREIIRTKLNELIKKRYPQITNVQLKLF